MATPRIRAACSASVAVLAPALPCAVDLGRAPAQGESAADPAEKAEKAQLRLVKAADLSGADQEALFALWKANMGGYAALSYDDSRKRAEMFDPDARYLIVRAAAGAGALLGFASFRFDTEETLSPRDAEVVYW